MNKVSYSQLNNQISAVLQQQGDLSGLKQQWTKEVQRLDVFLDMFLDKYNSRLLGDKTNSPEWNLYTAKTEAYNNYARALRSVDYFIAKQKYATNGK